MSNARHPSNVYVAVIINCVYLHERNVYIVLYIVLLLMFNYLTVVLTNIFAQTFSDQLYSDCS